MGGFEGQAVVVTGAAGGLGRSIAGEFVESGANVVLVDVETDRLREVSQQLGFPDRVMVYTGDLTDEDDVIGLAEATADRFGTCDVLVNNAGILGAPGPLASLSTAAWNETIAVNLTAAMLCTRELGRLMIDNGHGAVVNIASVGAHSPNTSPTYGVSKAGLIALTRHTAVEWGPLGVRTNAVSPGFVRTEMSAATTPTPICLRCAPSSPPCVASASRPTSRRWWPIWRVTPPRSSMARNWWSTVGSCPPR